MATWPEVTTASAGAAARGSPRDVAIGIYASEINCPVVHIRPWDRGALDRAAQIAEGKYCRPQARPFGLGFPRKVPVFPICAPAAL
jgi:hypothetical protein